VLYIYLTCFRVAVLWSLRDPCSPEAEQIAECVTQIAELRPDLAYLAPAEVTIRWDQQLGEGGNCTAYRAEWKGMGAKMPSSTLAIFTLCTVPRVNESIHHRCARRAVETESTLRT